MSAAELYEPDDWQIPDPPDGDTSLAEQLEFHLNRAHWYRTKIDNVETQRDRMVARYHQWCQTATVGWQRKAAESEAWIEYAVGAAIDTDPKAPKTYRLPSGTIRSNPPRPSLKIDDQGAFEEWVSEQTDPALWARWTCTPNAVTVKKAIVEDGEIVAGCRIEPGTRSVTISTENDNR